MCTSCKPPPASAPPAGSAGAPAAAAAGFGGGGSGCVTALVSISRTTSPCTVSSLTLKSVYLRHTQDVHDQRGSTCICRALAPWGAGTQSVRIQAFAPLLEDAGEAFQVVRPRPDAHVGLADGHSAVPAVVGAADSKVRRPSRAVEGLLERDCDFRKFCVQSAKSEASTATRYVQPISCNNCVPQVHAPNASMSTCQIAVDRR